MKTIIVDTLGCDNTHQMLLGTLEAVRLNKDILFKVFTDEVITEKYENLEVIACKKVMPLNGNPMSIIDNNDDTSLALGLKALSKDSEAIGIISGGSTGALLVGSIAFVGNFEKVKFPALGCTLLHESGKKFALLDCGANLDVKPERAVLFAKLGSAFISSLSGIKNPRVGLLNIGREEGKGNAFAKEAFNLLKNEEKINFVGNIEGIDVFTDKADVLVADGFSGNILLKNAEATAKICRNYIEEVEGKSEAFNKVFNNFAYTELGAAIVLGSKKIILKAHGAANIITVPSLVRDLLAMNKGNFIEKMEEYLK